MKAHMETIFIVYVQHLLHFVNIETLKSRLWQEVKGRGSIYETEASRGADGV